MKIHTLTRNTNLNSTALAFIGGISAVTMAQAPAHTVYSGYSNSIHQIEKMGYTSGSNISVKINLRQSQLAVIKDNLSLSNDELSDILGISRKTLYNWEKQGINKESDRQRVFELNLIAEDWKYNGLSTNKEDLYRPVLEFASVMQLLRAKALDHEKIIFAGQRLAHQAIKPESSLI